MHMLYFYIDLIWVPIALIVVHKEQRGWTIGFLLCGMIMMRMLIELIESTGYPTGILPFLHASAFQRGLAVYSVFYMLFMILAYYSPKTDKHVFMSGAISMFILASVICTLVMVL